MWKAKSVFPSRGTKKAHLISCIKIKQDNLENRSVRATPYTIQESTEETQRDGCVVTTEYTETESLCR